MSTILIFSGLFIIAAAVLEREWFFTNWRAALFVRVFGRGGTRVFYGMLGFGALILGFSNRFPIPFVADRGRFWHTENYFLKNFTIWHCSDLSVINRICNRHHSL